MDVHPNASSSATSSLFGEFIPHAMEGGEDGSLEWLSIYVEDCLSSTPTYFISPSIATSTPSSNPPQQPPIRKPSLHDPPVPAKARTKRRRLTPSSLPLDADQSLYAAPSEPLLHHQTCWLADSELLLPKREEDSKAPATEAAAAATAGEAEEEEEELTEMEEDGAVQGRRCSHCLSQKTPQWRAGPLGPKTLCNACGVRFKSGRLLPEYRPAKSPTFVSYKHSNSHKKVMEMRMALLSSTSS